MEAPSQPHMWWAWAAAGERVLSVVKPVAAAANGSLSSGSSSLTSGSPSFSSVQAEAAHLCDLEFDLARVSLPFLVLSFALEFVLGQVRAARRRRRRKPQLVVRSTGKEKGDVNDDNDPVYRASSTMDSLGLATLNILLDTFTKAIGILPYTWLWAHFRFITIQDSWLSWCLVFVLVDFCYYWMHRRAHEWNWSWAAHSVHHGSEDFNLTVGVRQGVLQQLGAWIFYLPLSVLGVSPRLYHTHLMIHSVYQFYMHTKLVPKLGPLEKIFNTPSQHRVHHGRNPYCIDKNYGGTLCIWDRLFGTFAEENVNEGDEPVKYGLVHPANTLEPIWQNTMYWFMMRDTVASVKSAFGKLEVLWHPPSWRPDGPPVKAPPTDEHPAVRYDPPMTRTLTVYCAVQSLLVWYPAAALASSSAARREYAWVSLAVIAVATVCGLSCIGLLMSGAARAWDAERARLVVMLAALGGASSSWSLASWWGSEVAMRATREYAALWPDAVRGLLLPMLLLSTVFAICIGPAMHTTAAAATRKLH